jgi:hypothetical protein
VLFLNEESDDLYTVVATLNGHEGHILGVFAHHTDQDLLWSIGADGIIRSWNIKMFNEMDGFGNVE